VTHHGSPPASPTGSAAAGHSVGGGSTTSRSAPDCHVCRGRCSPFVRLRFLRRPDVTDAVLRRTPAQPAAQRRHNVGIVGHGDGPGVQSFCTIYAQILAAVNNCLMPNGLTCTYRHGLPPMSRARRGPPSCALRPTRGTVWLIARNYRHQLSYRACRAGNGRRLRRG
jgi:hypothetical protein